MTRITPRNLWLRIALLFFVAVLTVGDARILAAGSQSILRKARLDALLNAALDDGAHDQQRVIIRVRPGTRSAVKRALTSHADDVLAEHESIDALTVVVHGEDLATLANARDVISVSVDAVVRPHGGPGLLGGLLGALTSTLGKTVSGLLGTVGNILDPGEPQPGPPVPPRVLRETLGLNGTWTGRGVGVAVIDSGLEMSSEFDGRVRAFYDFTRGGVRGSTFDDYGHGTHVAGTIGGSGALSPNRDYRGLAPNVTFVVLKVLDANGAGYTSDVIKAVDFAVANREALGIDIINLSLGHPIYEPAASDPLVQAVERAARAGVVVVAAAGNMGKNPTTGLPGYAGITSPGNAPSAITAGAVRTDDTVSRRDDRIPDYSSSGPTWYDAQVKPDIVAPGHNIIAVAAKRGTLYQKYPQLKAADSDYMRLSGTSMATAVTSGVVALMLEANHTNRRWDGPPLTPNTVKGALQYTAFAVRNDLGLEYDPLRQGAGALNGRGAIELGQFDRDVGPAEYALAQSDPLAMDDDWR